MAGRLQKNDLIAKIKDLAQENIGNKGLVRIDRLERNSSYIKNFNQAKINIELGLERIMENLTSVGKGRS
ncbi:hypothetical protein [Marinobacter maritimus]|uniref:hypothetical protein n=1 Tax=Marinobacter maritimus TaxID=277961 RepID=UPI0011AA2D9F|nr:hypothetical protein [Marinobacter maritimus]